MSRGKRRRGLTIAGVGVAAVVVVGVAMQVLLPKVAAERVREKLEKYGSVESVEVKAWPAVKLMWKDADEARVRAGTLKLSLEQAEALLGEAKGVERVRARVKSVEVDGVRLTDAELEKHGRGLRAEGVMSAADVKRALPEGLEVALVKSEGGKVEVQASGGLFGVSASVDAVAEAEEGKLVARPTALLLSGFKLTVFDDPSVYVEGVQARALEGEGGEGASYELSIWASLR